MQKEQYYSVRMRAAQDGAHENGGKHISGGELLSTYDDMKESVHFLLDKALSHSRGQPDFMQIQFESITEPITSIPPLPVTTNRTQSAEEGQRLAKTLLNEAGVPLQTIQKAYEKVPESSVTRGAILIDIHSGERIDQRNEQGVRVSRMDWPDANFITWADHHNMPKNPRIKEALTLTSKVNHHPATIAELCWSDDPDYVTGYVASATLGYQRITKLKEHGDEQGCRIFFVDGSTDINAYIQDLEKQPIFINWEDDHDDT